jgi:DNA-binding PadR family transcriptional regulator
MRYRYIVNASTNEHNRSQSMRSPEEALMRNAHFTHDDRDRGQGRRRAHGDWPPMFGPGFGRGGPWPGGRGRGSRGGRRGRRGDVRTALLALLSERPMHGYEMIQQLDERTGGIWKPSPGSVYPTLQMLEDEGLVTSTQSEGRKLFTLTDEGAPVAAQAAENPPWATIGDETVAEALDVRQAAFGLMNALREVGTQGSDEQRARALEVLADARRKLYAILAEEG